MCPGECGPSRHEQGGAVVASRGHEANVDLDRGQVKDLGRRVREGVSTRPLRSGHTGRVSSRLVAVLTLLGLVSAILLAVRLLPLDAMLISGG